LKNFVAVVRLDDAVLDVDCPVAAIGPRHLNRAGDRYFTQPLLPARMHPAADHAAGGAAGLCGSNRHVLSPHPIDEEPIGDGPNCRFLLTAAV
jgi:hypothetical protein